MRGVRDHQHRHLPHRGHGCSEDDDCRRQEKRPLRPQEEGICIYPWHLRGLPGTSDDARDASRFCPANSTWEGSKESVWVGKYVTGQHDAHRLLAKRNLGPCILPALPGLCGGIGGGKPRNGRSVGSLGQPGKVTGSQDLWHFSCGCVSRHTTCSAFATAASSPTKHMRYLRRDTMFPLLYLIKCKQCPHTKDLSCSLKDSHADTQRLSQPLNRTLVIAHPVKELSLFWLESQLSHRGHKLCLLEEYDY